MTPDKVLEITTGSVEEFERETLQDLNVIEEGGEGRYTITFSDPEMFRKILTGKRQELIEEVMEHPPDSIRQLAEQLGRGLREVHDDVHLLESYGILELEEESGRKKPRIPYDRIHIEIDLPIPGNGDTARALPS